MYVILWGRNKNALVVFVYNVFLKDLLILLLLSY